eukprot:UN23077
MHKISLIYKCPKMNSIFKIELVWKTCMHLPIISFESQTRPNCFWIMVTNLKITDMILCNLKKKGLQTLSTL